MLPNTAAFSLSGLVDCMKIILYVFCFFFHENSGPQWPTEVVGETCELLVPGLEQNSPPTIAFLASLLSHSSSWCLIDFSFVWHYRCTHEMMVFNIRWSRGGKVWDLNLRNNVCTESRSSITSIYRSRSFSSAFCRLRLVVLSACRLNPLNSNA